MEAAGNAGAGGHVVGGGAPGGGSSRVGSVLHVVFTSLLVLVCVFMGWFSAFVVYRLYRGRNAG